jgi:hypothetical protein
MPLNVVDHFENREPELALFRRMLAGEEPDKRILCITVAPEQGKTWFVQRLHHECELQQVPVALLDFDQERSGMIGDVFSAVSEVRRCLGDERTPAICTCEAAITRGALPTSASGDGGVEFGERSGYRGADIHDIAGRDLYRIDTLVTGALSPEQLTRHKDDLGRALCDDLAHLDRAVLLVDTFERVPEETRGWLERWLFQALRRLLPHLLLVVAGRLECRHFFDQPHLWSHLVIHLDSFESFNADNALAYFRRRGLCIAVTETSFLQVACVSPGRMAQVGDWLEQTRGDAR